jgi:hypothetical protein
MRARRIPRVRPWLVAGAAALLSGLVAACILDEERTRFGGPEGLHDRQLPEPMTAVAPDPGAGPEVGDGGAAAVCDADGLPDSGPCAVSWRKDIYAYITGAGHCGDPQGACHAPQNPRSAGQKPPIHMSDPDDAYRTLVAFRGSRFAGRRYIDPCSRDPSVSAIRCNLTMSSPGKAYCDPAMPQAGQVPAEPLDDAGLDKLDTWLRCGAPNN